MCGLIDVMKGMELRHLLVDPADELWDEYWAGVTSVLEGEIMMLSTDDEEERKVRGTFEKKLQFIQMDHWSSHYQRPLPLLTPPIIEALAQQLDEVKDAHGEVSNIFG